MGIISTIKFLESVIRHSKVFLDNACFGLVITITYDYADATPESMIEFDTDFAAAMLELDGKIQDSFYDSLIIEIPDFSGSIIGATMVGSPFWNAVMA